MDESSVSYFGDISQIVRNKERELHEAHELRCNELERVIKEKQAQHTDLIKRFELLREDFQYNLSLLDARDKEISRLSESLRKITRQYEESDATRRSLQQQLETANERELARREKAEKDAKTNQTMFAELQQEIETLRWTTEHEVTTRNRDIERLKTELRALSISRDEALEAQRNDMTSTFESLLQQREEAFHQAEADVAQEMDRIEKHFETLQVENNQLKIQLKTLQRNSTATTQESIAREEKIKQLQWTVEDLTSEHQNTIDAYERKLYEANKNLQEVQEASQTMETHYKHELHETAYRSTKEHSEATTTSYRQQIASLERSLSETKNLNSLQQHEISELRSALQDLQTLHQEVVVKYQLVDAHHKEDTIKIHELRSSTSELEAKVARLEPQLMAKEQEVKSLTERFDNYAKASEHRFLSLKQEYHNSSTESHELLRAAVEAEYITQHQEEEARIHHDLMTTKRRAEDAESKCAAATSKVHDLQTEVNALQLRLRAYEAQSNHKNEVRHQRLNNNLSALDIGSPVFSEDLGPVSIPHSIPNTPSLRYDFATYSSYEDESPRRQAPGSRHRDYDSEHHTAEVAALEKENNKLKLVIKDMRLELEQMTRDMQSTEEEKEEAKTKISQLELRQSSIEIQQLKDERTRLMDVSNELRAALYKAECDELNHNDEKQAQVSPSRSMTESATQPASQPPQPAVDSQTMEESFKVSAIYTMPDIHYGALATKASQRETMSQQLALQKLRTAGRKMRAAPAQPSQRKVLNYARSGVEDAM